MLSINTAVMNNVIVFIFDLKSTQQIRDEESVVRESVEFEVLRKEEESGVNECRRRKVGK